MYSCNIRLGILPQINYDHPGSYTFNKWREELYSACWVLQDIKDTDRFCLSCRNFNTVMTQTISKE